MEHCRELGQRLGCRQWRGRRNFHEMIILGGKGPKMVREVEKRCQDLRRKLLSKGGMD